MKRVIVTDADYISAFYITNSLGQKGIEVITCDNKKIALSYLSKYSVMHFVYPNPAEKPEEFISVLKEKIVHLKPALLIPVGLETTATIAKYKSEFNYIVKIQLPSWKNYVKAYDKFKTFCIAKKIGIPVPKTFIFNKYNLNMIIKQLGYPIVVKSRLKSGLVYYANDMGELKKYINLILKKDGLAPILQQYISGYGVGFFALYNKGKVQVTFSHKRLREYPLSGGPSTLRESIYIPKINELGIKLLDKLDWDGVAMVEFKFDQKTNEYYLIEVNPKFWGSLPLSIYSGVDFPYYLYQVGTTGKITNKCSYYAVGVRCRNLLPGDILWVLDSAIHGLSIKEFFRFKNMYYDVISTNELLPIIYIVVKTIYCILRDIVIKRLKNVF